MTEDFLSFADQKLSKQIVDFIILLVYEPHQIENAKRKA